MRKRIGNLDGEWLLFLIVVGWGAIMILAAAGVIR